MIQIDKKVITGKFDRDSKEVSFIGIIDVMPNDDGSCSIGGRQVDNAGESFLWGELSSNGHLVLKRRYSRKDEVTLIRAKMNGFGAYEGEYRVGAVKGSISICIYQDYDIEKARGEIEALKKSCHN